MTKKILGTQSRTFGYTRGKSCQTIYTDPPWRFQNCAGKMAPEHKRLSRHSTMKLEAIAAEKSHLSSGRQMPFSQKAWGFVYKTGVSNRGDKGKLEKKEPSSQMP